MTAADNYLIVKLNKAINDKNTNNAKYYYEMIRDIKLQEQWDTDLKKLEITMKEAKMYLIDKLPDHHKQHRIESINAQYHNTKPPHSYFLKYKIQQQQMIV